MSKRTENHNKHWDVHKLNEMLVITRESTLHKHIDNTIGVQAGDDQHLHHFRKQVLCYTRDFNDIKDKRDHSQDHEFSVQL